jgi:hypothetical protein
MRTNTLASRPAARAAPTRSVTPVRASAPQVQIGNQARLRSAWPIGQTAGHAPPIVHDALAAPGQALDPAIRAAIEPHLGRDLTDVRVHTGPKASASAEAIGANAYAAGRHIVFGAGGYHPETHEGRRRLAHELVHVVQQDAGAPIVQRDAPKEDPKVTKLKADLVKTFDLSAVTDTADAKWTEVELDRMKSALTRVPMAERAALKGVELRRVVRTTDFGNIASGFFHQEIDARTGVRRDRIEIANDAFGGDEDYAEGGSHEKFGGVVEQGAPSEGVASHEIGHAVESLDRRQAEAARVNVGLSGGDPDTAQAAVDAAELTVKVSSGKKVKVTRRLAEFVAVVESNKVVIAGRGLGDQIDGSWPDNPVEAYAELYRFALTAPAGLKGFDKTGALASFFTSPVGPKGPQVKKAADWLASHK